MNEVDWIIVIVLGFSALVSLLRGFVKEALSLLTWVAAFVVSIALGPRLAVLLAGWFGNEVLRLVIAFLALFLCTLLVGGLVNSLIVSLVAKAGLSPIDRLLGTAFGLLRGSIVVLAVVMLLPMVIAVEEQEWWRESLLLPHFISMEGWAAETFGEVNEWRASLLRGLPAS